jgi:hypothetical protein
MTSSGSASSSASFRSGRPTLATGSEATNGEAGPQNLQNLSNPQNLRNPWNPRNQWNLPNPCFARVSSV